MSFVYNQRNESEREESCEKKSVVNMSMIVVLYFYI